MIKVKEVIKGGLTPTNGPRRKPLGHHLIPDLTRRTAGGWRLWLKPGSEAPAQEEGLCGGSREEGGKQAKAMEWVVVRRGGRGSIHGAARQGHTQGQAWGQALDTASEGPSRPGGGAKPWGGHRGGEGSRGGSQASFCLVFGKRRVSRETPRLPSGKRESSARLGQTHPGPLVGMKEDKRLLRPRGEVMASRPGGGGRR